MTVLTNRTPFAVATGFGRDMDGRPALFVSVKATFTWDRGGRVAAAPPVPVLTHDEVMGEGPAAAILRAAEVGPRKPKVDVLLAGALVMPVEIEEIDVALEVGQRLKKVVRVIGPRRWIPGIVRDRVPSKPRPFTRAPIDWRHSFGGANTEDARLHESRNPAGCGLARGLADYDSVAVPLFEDPSAPISSWKSRPTPKGFGPVAPHWPPRAGRAGSYGGAWRTERAPLPPADLDPQFFNVAPDDQQLPSYVPGEEVRLRYMTVNGRDRFLLPDLDVPIVVATAEILFDARARVDTIIIEPDELRFSVVARATCPLGTSPVVYEVAVGAITPAHRRALETGKRYLSRRAAES